VVGVAAVPGSDMAGEVVGAEGAEQTSSPKIESIEKKRLKLEQQMVELEEEKQRVIKLSQLAAQKAALQEQLAAIKEEMAEVKSGKGETGGIPSAEENVAGVDHEASETPGEEAAEHAEGETEEDEADEGSEKPEKEESDEDDKEEKEPKEKVLVFLFFSNFVCLISEIAYEHGNNHSKKLNACCKCPEPFRHFLD
jgi:hypothetical protein